MKYNNSKRLTPATIDCSKATIGQVYRSPEDFDYLCIENGSGIGFLLLDAHPGFRNIEQMRHLNAGLLTPVGTLNVELV